ncbi:hypothetical protein Daus18300_008403 [Diaporthe australafricana]|uniref:P-loop containing nucleoside triphosphate hydrolase protein n=1 Tax=Diaporthe australafricana TaxID=127596 RepID=A0ABR3WIG9_9PEZI
MAYIKTDSPQPDSRADRASDQEVDTTSLVPKIDWSSDWRNTSLFAFSPPTVKKEEDTSDSLRLKTPTTDTVLAPTWKLPTKFTFGLPVPPDSGGESSSSSSESEASSSDTASPGPKADQIPEPAPAPPRTLSDLMKKQTMDRRRQLLSRANKDVDGLDEIKTAPVFTESARDKAERQAFTSSDGLVFPQYGLLAGDAGDEQSDELFYYNVAAPSSFFICGSQGSGKSHTLSCLLENSLFPSAANELPHPLTGIVFHYDTFISDSQGSPCEAAYLSTNPAVRVRVLCAPTNIAAIRRTYAGLPNVTIEPLSIREQDLTTKRMMDLMAVRKGETMPLYMHVVNRLLRDLRLRQQQNGTPFDYQAFRKLLAREDLTDSQRVPLNQRLETLESFMAPRAGAVPQQQQQQQQKTKKKAAAAGAKPAGNDWAPRAGQLTIVDLSCPCVTPEGACSLFNICLSLFLEQDARRVGRVVALDEAHKYMNESGEASALTEQLLATIRLQRHLGARVIISTQEPTVSPRLLDLCSVTVVHRFTSPEWLRALRRHLAGAEETAGMLAHAAAAGSGCEDSSKSGASSDSGVDDLVDGLADGVGSLSVTATGATMGKKQAAASLFAQIVGLRVGEALLFSPNAVVGVGGGGVARKLGSGVLKVRVRNRVTEDGGRSVMAG